MSTPETPPSPSAEPAGPMRRRFGGPIAIAVLALLGLVGVATAAAADRGDRDRSAGGTVENIADLLVTGGDNGSDNDTGNDGVNAEARDGDRDRDGRRGGRDGDGNRRGGFRFDCDVSHYSDDDPIVFPGEVGAAHGHMFWGNTSTDAFSTEASLLANAESTCDGRRDGNQAAYWTPVLLDADGVTVEPTDIDVRYRGRRNVNPIPNGLEMLATSDVAGAEANDFEIEEDGNGIEMEVSYPNCLAVDAAGSPVLSSDDNISHTAYSNDGDCPVSHPYRIPRLQIDVEFDVAIDSDWRLSSDMNGAAPGSSLHADYMAAWTDDPPGS